MSTAATYYDRLLEQKPELVESLYPRMTDYIPHEPTIKQLAFLMLPHKEAFFGGAAGGGKALDIRTRILTSLGFREMGSLQPGELVYDERYRPTKVLAVSEVMYDHECYDVYFSDGSSIKADAEHTWGVHYTALGDLGSCYLVKTTKQIAEALLHLDRLELYVRTSSHARRIIGVVPCESVPVKCIKVDSESSLYLAGETLIPTHNSDALLMAALQYVDVPGYSAIIFRKTLTDLELPNSLLSRCHDWLSGTPAKWSAKNFCYYFPTSGAPATLQFGYIGDANASSRYQGIECQTICFDELAQHWDEDYLFLFSRLRKLCCPIHQLDEVGRPLYVEGCPQCDIRRIVPLRMRSASNPPRAGDRGSTGWIKERFQIERQSDGSYRGCHPKRPHIPSFLEDNPFIDQSGYADSLEELDPITREQLRRGDWGVSADGRFRKSWARYYTMPNPDTIVLAADGNGPSFKVKQCRCFVTVDPAASQKEGPGDKHIWRKAPSHTVISTWLLTPNFDLIWFGMTRVQKEIPELFPLFGEVYREYLPQFIAIEANGINVGVYQVAKRLGLPVRQLMPRGQDKVVRATDASVRMEAGKVYLPVVSKLIEVVDSTGQKRMKPWREVAEQEVFTWTGHPQEPADIVDTLSYAAMLISEEASRNERGIKSFARPEAID